jgi:hypothetical protein
MANHLRCSHKHTGQFSKGLRTLMMFGDPESPTKSGLAAQANSNRRNSAIGKMFCQAKFFG